jgi:hypothetical protein
MEMSFGSALWKNMKIILKNFLVMKGTRCFIYGSEMLLVVNVE